MRQGNEMSKPFFPSPWTYYNVPVEDAEDLLNLYVNTYLASTNPTLPGAIQRVMYPDAWVRTQLREHPEFISLVSPKAHEAAKWFIIADFIGMKYERLHPTFKMGPAPEEILSYLKPPYNGMRLLGYDDQVKYKKSLPDNLKREVYIDA